MKTYMTVLKFSVTDTIFRGKNSNEHNSVKMWVELRFLLSAHRLMAVYNCTKFHENFLDGIKVIMRTRFLKEKFQRGIIP